MNADRLTTIVGAAAGALTASQTILAQVQPGTSLHAADYVNLGFAALMALWGWATNKAKA